MSVYREFPAWRLIVDGKATIAEVPIWCQERGELFWIDLFGPTLNATNLATGQTETWTFTDRIGCYGLLDDLSGAIIALSSGIFHLDFTTNNVERIHEQPYDIHHFRFNDGRCDRVGRFWAGTSRWPSTTMPFGTSSFWRLDSQLSRQLDNLSIANGIAFSPRGDVMYLADRPNWQILAFDYDQVAGVASGRRVFAKLPQGYCPDGAAVDVEGGYWIAVYPVGLILRFLPNGELDRELSAPLPNSTMVSFGGPGMRTMFVTTARPDTEYADRGTTDRIENPRISASMDGGVFAADVGIAGIPEPRFNSAWLPASGRAGARPMTPTCKTT
jgi:sugar lactone lactonase YvrE